jgi:uncharacterized membrane protein YgcG
MVEGRHICMYVAMFSFDVFVRLEAVVLYVALKFSMRDQQAGSGHSGGQTRSGGSSGLKIAWSRVYFQGKGPLQFFSHRT